MEVDSLILLVERLKQENSGWRQRYQQLVGNELLGKIYEEQELSRRVDEQVMDTSFMNMSPDSSPILADRQNDCQLLNMSANLAATALARKRPSETLTEMTSVPPTPDSCVCAPSDLAAGLSGEAQAAVACSSYAWSRLASCLLHSLLRQPALLRHTAIACGLELHLAKGGRTLASYTSTQRPNDPGGTRQHNNDENAVFSIDLPASIRQRHDPSTNDAPCWHTDVTSHSDIKNRAAVHI